MIAVNKKDTNQKTLKNRYVYSNSVEAKSKGNNKEKLVKAKKEHRQKNNLCFNYRFLSYISKEYKYKFNG